MERPLYVAAGGGGDALAAALLHRAYGPPGPATIATFSWDRLIVDPLPGPRSFSDFEGLETVAGSSMSSPREHDRSGRPARPFRRLLGTWLARSPRPSSFWIPLTARLA